MNNLDKAINNLLQLMLVDNNPAYLNQLNDLYLCKKKEEEINECINAADISIKHYASPALNDLNKSKLSKSIYHIGYSLDELASKHNLDPALLKSILDYYVDIGYLVFVENTYSVTSS